MGIVLIFLGFGGGGFNRDTQVELKPGQETKIGRYTLRSTSLKVNDDGQKQMITAAIAVFVDGKQIDTLYPAKWFFRKHENEPTTEVAIRRTLAEDLYITLGGYDAAQQAASVEIHVNPLVNWVWMGFGILALGTGIALLPERAFSFALARLPMEAAATTTALTLLLAILFATPAFAQPGMSGDQNTRTSFYARTEFEKQMQHEIVCTCGACGHANIGECRKDPVARRTRCAASSRRWSTRAKTTTRSFKRSSRNTAARRCWARRSIAASTASRGSCRTRWA